MVTPRAWIATTGPVARSMVLVPLVAVGCSWSLPEPRPGPDALVAPDLASPVDRPVIIDAPRDVPDATAPPQDVAQPVDLPSVDVVARDVAPLPDRVDVVVVDRPVLIDAPSVDRPIAPDVVVAPDVVSTECVPGARRTCYTGPPASRGMGTCRDGIQTCGMDGRWSDTCAGQVLPDCNGRVCGSDGCGGSCGTCTGGPYCDDTGRCAAPTCGATNFTITCPDATRCPRDSHCMTGGRCVCDEGFVAESCAGVACGACTFPDWWCRRAFFCGTGAITCAGGYLCPLRSRCDEATRSCDCEAGFVAVDCNGARCTSCPGVSYRCIPL